MTSDTGETDSLRRTLIFAGGLGLSNAALGSTVAARETTSAAPNSIDEGAVVGGHVDFPAIHATTEAPDTPPPNQDPPSQRVGFAIMGLGRLALQNIMPAFAQSKYARPVALISGDSGKMRTVAAQYGIAATACYSYGDMDRIRDNPEIQVVYVVLPNTLHKDAVIRAARLGKHVLCEKPMATNPEEARVMIDACRKAGRKLMVAYRCQYEVYNRELAKRARAGAFGKIQLIDAINTQNQGDPTQWRQIRALAGGGSLPDVGLYCLNTTRALLGEEPIEVSASIHTPLNDPRFREVESTVSFTLKFPSGVIANCASSYSAHEHRNIRIFGASGSAEIENAFAYSGQKLRTMHLDGKIETMSELSLPQKNQFSLEIDHMAKCVRADIQPRTPGEEGLQDQIIMAAIYDAANTGKPVRLEPAGRPDAFRGPDPDDS